MNIKCFFKSIVLRHSFSISTLVKKYKIRTSGVLHVGANFGQEADIYDELGFANIYWVEGWPDFILKLKENVGHRNKHRIIEAMVSDVPGEELVFSVTSNTGSSTLFEPTDLWHKTFDEIKVVGKKTVACKRLDEVLLQELSDEELRAIKFFVLDVEGAELKALRSMGEMIDSLDYALVEVSFRNNFEGGPLLRDIDDFMIGSGFVRVYLKTGAASGDALYKKVNHVSFYQKYRMRIGSALIQILSRIRLTDLSVAFRIKLKSWVSA